MPPRRRARWQQGLLWFLKCITLRTPRQIVLKSPPHTFRVKILLEMFPKARFVHIVRNPFVIYPLDDQPLEADVSQRRLADADLRRLGGARFHDLRADVRSSSSGIAGLIPPGQFCEVRYEDLVAQPLAQMERIYEELRLGEFGKVRPKMEAYFAAKADYKTNRYQLPAGSGGGDRPPLGQFLRSLRLFQRATLAYAATAAVPKQTVRRDCPHFFHQGISARD